MKTALSLLALVLLACALPRTASAQCEDGCAKLVRDGIQTGWGCDYMEGSGMYCRATRTTCNLERCMYAYLTTPGGRLVEMRNGCAERATVPGRVATAMREAGNRLAASLSLHMRTAALAPPRRVGTGPG
jgi:hypothetical protein